jgi:cytochrome c
MLPSYLLVREGNTRKGTQGKVETRFTRDIQAFLAPAQPSNSNWLQKNINVGQSVAKQATREVNSSVGSFRYLKGLMFCLF